MSSLRGFGMKAVASYRGLTLERLRDVAALRLGVFNAFSVMGGGGAGYPG